ncbi:C4-dicarboxylate TRAP transporter substrate-binding protein [Agrococcus versicolor]|uniref:C4-dicarboxylate TRAP transporter substrate-binding protein n=1 Tax=Agrococcus versicolor TaxID=501482 RepID=A0ABN3ALE3_9MICO
MTFTTTTPRGARRAVLGVALVGALALGACSSGGGGSAAGDDAIELTLATSAIAGTPNAAAQDWFLDAVEEATDGSVTFDRTAPESICTAAEIVECLRDGRADVGVTIPDYTPQYFPTVSVVGIPFVGQNSAAITASLYDLHTQDEQAVALMERNGLHYVSAWPVGRLLLGTDAPVESIADLQGISARASGPVVQQVLSDAGMSITAVTASESYEAVERGVIDGVGGAIDFAVNYRIMELLPYWTDPGIGQYSTFGMWFSADAWERLSAEQQEAVTAVEEEFNEGAAVEAFNDQAATQCDAMLEATTVDDLTAWSEDATEEWIDQVGDSAREAWTTVAADFGLEDPDSLLDAYEASLDEHAELEYVDATSSCVEAFATR